MKSGLTTKFLLIFVGLQCLALVATANLVWRAANENIKADANRSLNVAARVFDSLLSQNSAQLQDRVVLLAGDFEFKRAVATNKRNEIIDSLAEHGERIGADMVFLLDAQGEVIVSTHDRVLPQGYVDELLQGRSTELNRLSLADSSVFQLVVAPVSAPDIIAWVGMGFAIDPVLLQRLKNITNTDISLMFHQTGEAQYHLLSTLEDRHRPDLDSVPTFDSAVIQFMENLGQQQWLTHEQRLLDERDWHLSVLHSTSLQQSVAGYAPLWEKLLLAAVLALVLMGIAAWWIGRVLNRTFTRYSHAAQSIGAGNYSSTPPSQNDLVLGKSQELKTFGDRFESMRAAIAEREKRITHQAQHDPLTGVPNRNYMREHLLKRSTRGDAAPFCLAILHIDKVHELTDVYGSEVCDELVKLVATRVQGVLKSGDLIARLDGIDFLLFFDATGSTNIASFGRRILDLLAAPFRVGSIEIKTSARMGFSVFPEHGQSYEELVRRAYIGLSKAQNQRAPLAVYQAGQDEVHSRQIRITNRLQQAIKHKGFQLLYQPQFDLQRQRVTQVEALIRWEDEELGSLSPEEFIPLAEHTGDITGITEWVFAEVIAQLDRWSEASVAIGVSMNLSARDLLRKEFIQQVIDTASLRKFDGGCLVLEVTESAMIEDPNRAIANLRRLHDAGLKIAMDDFGTGYSSLSQLKELPIHELKMDKAFILKLDKDISDQKIVRSTIDMAHSLNLRVVAEGVESLATLQLLESFQCDMVQGHCLSRPLTLAELENWLEQTPTMVSARQH